MWIDGKWRSYGFWTAAALGAQAMLALFGLALALRLLPAGDHLVWIAGLAAANILTLLDLGYPQRVQRALQFTAVTGAIPADAPWATAPRAGLAWVVLRLLACTAVVLACLAWPQPTRMAAILGTAAALTGLNAARGGFGLVTAALFADQRFVAERRARLGFIAVQAVVLPAALAVTRSAPLASGAWAAAASAAAVASIALTPRLTAELRQLRPGDLVATVSRDLRRGRHEVGEWLGLNVPAVALGNLALPVAIAVLSPTDASQFAIVSAGFANINGLSRELFDGARADAARRWFAGEVGVRPRVLAFSLVAGGASVVGLAALLVVTVALSRVAPPGALLVAAYLALIAVETVQVHVTMTTMATGYVRFGVVATMAALVYAAAIVPAARMLGAPGIPLSLLLVQTFFVYQYNIRKGLQHLDRR